METREQLTEDLINLKQKLGFIPRSKDYEKLGSFAFKHITKVFGSWKKAMEEVFGQCKRCCTMVEVCCFICGKLFSVKKGFTCGVKRFYCSKEHLEEGKKIGSPSKKKIPQEKLANDLKAVSEKIGSIPSRTDYIKLGAFCPSAVEKGFGSWGKAMVSVFGGIKPNPPLKRTLVKCELCGKEFYKKTNCLKSYPTSFCSKSHATKYKNAHKKGGAKRSKCEIMLCEMIKSEFPNLEVIECDREMLNGYEIDIFMPSLKLGIEWNGIFHFKPVFGQDGLDARQKNDKIKNKIAETKGINLITIPDLVNKASYVEECFIGVSKIIRELLAL